VLRPNKLTATYHA